MALAVLGIALVTAFEASSRILRSQAGALRTREAVAVAESKLEEIAAGSRDSVAAWLSGREGRVMVGGREYSWRTRLVREPGTRALWRAAVQVEWRSGDYRLETLLRRREWAGLGLPGQAQ